MTALRALAGDDPAIRIDVHLAHGPERRLAEDALDGLTRPFKEIPPKHFYDSRGSALFDAICELPEYYPTRTELAILDAGAEEIAAATRARELVELGSGSTAKARRLLDAMRSAGGPDGLRYIPVDVSERVVREAASTLVEDYPGLAVHGVVGDFERHLRRLPAPGDGARLVALLGGTIGNFTPGSRRRLLRDIAALLGPEDHLVLGTDLVKDPDIIEAAYNDRAGITAEFNRNVLHVMNRELGADFEPEAFEHVAFFDREHEWIEMRLRARRAMRVHVADLDLDVGFEAREELRTEISAKFTRRRLARDFAAAGLELRAWHTDPAGWFAVSVAGPAPMRVEARDR
ncbi:MAG TPA: L-histidine N(alpha)-methyltransferase [Solirubrobacteraceae bacterium]|nr:L-histidine N(alpha)-methyltransferase [Solirubrobacteraceae bacterium]